MAAVSIAVPRALAEPLAETLFSLLDVKAEAVQLAADEALHHEASSSAPVLEHVRELLAVATLLDQLGWLPDARSRDSVLTGPERLLREIVETTLATTLDRLVPTGVRPLAGTDLEALEQGLDRARALISLLRAIARDPPATGAS